MPITALESVTPSVSRIRNMESITFDTIDMVKTIFIEFLNRGVITGCSFDDDIWKLSNQVSNVTYSLKFDDDFEAAGWIGCGSDSYKICVKSYIVLNFGDLQLSTIQGVLRQFRRLVGMDAEEAVSIKQDANHILGLLRLLPGSSEYRDLVIAELDEYCDQHSATWKNMHQRTLAQFSSYLKFNEVLSSFWQTADPEHKLFYFPIYLWWNLTAILPLRPTEFLLTPRNCLDGNVLTVRRTRLKGGMNKISYRIDDDYECCRYTITEQLADEIRNYTRSTDSMPATELDTLLRLEPYFSFMGFNHNSQNRYFTYNNLNKCLKHFYREIICTAGTTVEQINLGDTRHLAMISLIISGGSPTICKELARHSDINTSSCYYSNISTFVECITLERFRRYQNSTAEFVGKNYYPISVPDNAHRVANGYCTATSIKTGDVSECLKIANANGNIGDCVICPHFYPDDLGVWFRFRDSSVGRDMIDMDCKYLIKMIELARKGLGDTEDIGSAILRLQHSCSRFVDCLEEKYLRGDEI